MALDPVKFGKDLPGYEYGPKEGPAIIVLQEWWGVTDEIKVQALELSKQGGCAAAAARIRHLTCAAVVPFAEGGRFWRSYRVLVPDLYKGKLGVTVEEAHHLMDNLDWPGAKAELGEAIEYLRSTGATKVGCTGFCMGGALSFVAAAAGSLAAIAPFYGTPDPQLVDVTTIKVPILLQSGSEDAMKGFSDKDKINETTENIKAAGGDITTHIYDGVGHAFMNRHTDFVKQKRVEMGLPQPEDLSSIQDTAWQRMVEFFAKHLK